MKCPLCDSECVQKRQVVIDSSGIEQDGGVRLYPAGQERLDRIEAVYEKYKHMDEILTTGNQIAFLKDKIAINVLYDLWQAIRRKE